MPGLDWLTQRPIAHRGLHDAAADVIENTPSAFAAAVAGGYAIETDVQISADGEAMVHHDHELGRLTERGGRLDAMTAAELRNVPFKATADRIIALGDLCDLVAGKTPLVVEIKSRFDGDRRLVQRVVQVLEKYAGPVAIQSFDPAVLNAARELAAGLPRGIVAERHYTHQEWGALTGSQRRTLAFLLHAFRTRPHFVAYQVGDLPSPAPFIARHVFGLPLLAWTVRREEDRLRAKRWADQVIFEGFRA